MECKICGKECKKFICKDCQYFLDNGSTEETIRRMINDKEANQIWKENEKYALELADAYYKSTIKNYKIIENDSKKNFGYNTFVDGIKLGLDTTLPMLSKEKRKEIIKKIEFMILFRKIPVKPQNSNL